MKLNIKKSLKGTASLILFCCLFFSSCSKILNKDPETTLTTTQVYRNIFDADAAVIGVYGKLMRLAKQYEVLNELRGDLMEVTDNADNNLREVNTHSTSANNPYADPRAFYSLINDCNDVLKNFDIMLKGNKFKINEYQQRYSDIGAIRSWLYLQLGIQYGSVPYVTNALDNIDAVKDASKYPLLPFNQLLDSLINFTKSLPYQLHYSADASILNPVVPATNPPTFSVVDGQINYSFFIEKNGLMGDLNLWRGNYTAAATYYRAMMEGTGYALGVGSANYYDFFKVSNFSSIPAPLDISYIRYKESDLQSFIDNNSQGWRSMFAKSPVINAEMIWYLPFNASFAPVDPFIELFSNVGGKYLVKPSQLALDYWNSQTQTNMFPFDARGVMTCRNVNGQPVIVKHLYNYFNEALNFVNVLQKNGQWYLNRAAAVHLHFAEAANRDGYTKLAYAFVNKGIGTTFVNGSPTDVTNFENTLNNPAPYDFDARNGQTPYFRGPWYRHEGIRGRANVTSTPASDTLSVTDMENSIINEDALELAYEGYRWPDLLRIALRRNDPSFIADKIYNKLLRDGNPAAATVRAKLMNREYYLPFKW